MRHKVENIFVNFLELLKVKHTKDFSNRYFNEHPHKYNLFGLSSMLSDYGVENAGTRIEDKENDIFNIECPFIAYIGSDFVVVYKTPKSPKGDLEPIPQSFSDSIHYLRNSKKITNTIEQFIQSWTGVILLAETTPNSIEPEYKEHRKKELLNIAQKSILILAGILIFGLAYINNFLYNNLGITSLLAVNLIGVYICYLLVLQQMHIHSNYADKICSLLGKSGKSDCNNVLESDAAKLFGIFGWSKIGLGYFSSNILLLLFFPQSVSILALINILALPYSFWSVWYQKVKTRQWCPLCLIVQALLWSIFILNLIFVYIRFPYFDIATLKDILFVGSLFASLVFTFNLVIPNLSSKNGMEQIKQEINSIKANEDVFEALLKKHPYYEVSKADYQILFGNPDADLVITVFTNPFCNPCAKMHKRIEKLLRETNRNICVQYLFSSFNHDLEFAVKYLIAAKLEKGQSKFEQIIANWF